MGRECCGADLTVIIQYCLVRPGTTLPLWRNIILVLVIFASLPRPRPRLRLLARSQTCRSRSYLRLQSLERRLVRLGRPDLPRLRKEQFSFGLSRQVADLVLVA